MASPKEEDELLKVWAAEFHYAINKIRVPDELDILANAYCARTEKYGPFKVSRKRVAASVDDEDEDEDEENSTSSRVDHIENIGVSYSVGTNPCWPYHKSVRSEASNPGTVVTEEAQASEKVPRADKKLKVMTESEKAEIAEWERWALLRSGAIIGTDEEQEVVRLVLRKEEEAWSKWVNGGKVVGLHKGPPDYSRPMKIGL